jgi:hypothetical protein
MECAVGGGEISSRVAVVVWWICCGEAWIISSDVIRSTTQGSDSLGIDVDAEDVVESSYHTRTPGRRNHLVHWLVYQQEHLREQG